MTIQEVAVEVRRQLPEERARGRVPGKHGIRCIRVAKRK